jgi:hypothetical protein
MLRGVVSWSEAGPSLGVHHNQADRDDCGVDSQCSWLIRIGIVAFTTTVYPLTVA